MTTNNTLHPGSVVRLSFDQGPRSFGLVLHGDVTVREDGTRLLPTVWGDREPVEDLAALVDEIGPVDEVDGYSVMRLAETILVPICEHVDTYDDEWGLACSEPGVPTYFSIPCGFDATRTITETILGHDVVWNLCDEHANEFKALVV